MATGSPRRVAVLGLDGVPFTLLKRLFDSGVMPNMAQAASDGTFVPMRTELPAISSVAWTSFMTGVGPGDHGIFGFTDLKSGEIALHLPSFDDIRSPVIWHMLPKRRSIVVNVPFTYPARPLNGTLIAGFVAPRFDAAVYPESLIRRLTSINYRIDVDAVRGRQDRRLLMTDLFDTLKIHAQVMEDLIKHEPWDLFIGVITGTDRLHHFFFDAHADPGNSFHKDFIDYYRTVDAFFGRLLQNLGTDTRLIALSDHGFTNLKTQVYLNYILKAEDLLFFKRPDPRGLEDIHPESKAFALDPTRIYISSRERFRSGILGRSESDELKARLKSRLQNLRLGDIGIGDHEGLGSVDEPLFDGVDTGEEIYRGNCLVMAPDLVVVPRRGFDVKAALNVPTATMKDIFTGMHTHDDAFLMVNDASLCERLAGSTIKDPAALIREVLEQS
ncbi:MAG: alkaline phosphatase family protein [Desulfomonile tiedjei]|uniref:Alkaline phosphatase family protein n=1 Tax=Desulfomonile tiedjei TaxID=2358 RepID=A0A9D6V4K1_9BACT|nr:alkaline phosphatase family protein [Desulfomonile tiedjei]